MLEKLTIITISIIPVIFQRSIGRFLSRNYYCGLVQYLKYRARHFGNITIIVFNSHFLLKASIAGRMRKMDLRRKFGICCKHIKCSSSAVFDYFILRFLFGVFSSLPSQFFCFLFHRFPQCTIDC